MTFNQIQINKIKLHWYQCTVSDVLIWKYSYKWVFIFKFCCMHINVSHILLPSYAFDSPSDTTHSTQQPVKMMHGSTSALHTITIIKNKHCLIAVWHSSCLFMVKLGLRFLFFQTVVFFFLVKRNTLTWVTVWTLRRQPKLSTRCVCVCLCERARHPIMWYCPFL